MSKMNWEHRNKMQKVYDSQASRSVKKRRPKKGTRAYPTQINKHLGHVKLKSKYDSKCGACSDPIKIGNLIWWSPEEKYVVHDQCFRKYFE